MVFLLPYPVGQLPRGKYYRRAAIRATLLLFMFPAATAGLRALKNTDYGKATFHAGEFNDDFSADFDVDRTDRKFPFDVVLSTTAHEIYVTVPLYAGRIPVWVNRPAK